MVAESRPYVRPASVRLVAAAIPVLAGVLALGGAVSLLDGLRRDDVVVPVRADFSRLPGGGASAPVPAAGLPDGSYVEVRSPEQVLRVPGATVLERLLAGADIALIGLAVLVGAVLLRRLLLTVAEGRPFAPGNARRLAVIAVLVGGVGTLAPALPDLAGMLVLDRLDAVGPDSPYGFGVSFPLLPLLVTPVLLALAEAFRRGAELADDVRGLV